MNRITATRTAVTPSHVIRGFMIGLACLVFGPASNADEPQERPNVLWITLEDMSTSLGCYGDPNATTPNIDAFATTSVRYTHAFATAPVCSPARSCLITGMYATSLGTQHLRSEFPLPRGVVGFPSYLRELGYYTSNNVKTDYNTSDLAELVEMSWDESSPSAHWRRRANDQPFFSVFNLMTTHQSRTSVWSFEEFETMISDQLSDEQRLSPQSLTLPPYYPDTPLIRRSMARYYDCVQAADRQVGELLSQLDEDGLSESTIVFIYSDHGMGMPRGKRVLHDSGLRVPLLIRFPERYSHLSPVGPGDVTDQLVSFVDFAPTMLNLVGQPLPEYMQGQPFLGESIPSPRTYVYGARDRVDEAYDLARSVRDDRYLYIRNYMPHLSWMQPEGYSDAAPMRRELKKMSKAGVLDEAQMAYAGSTRPIEELYDTQADPHQIRSLVDSPEHLNVLARMRGAHRDWVLDSKDLGFLVETEVYRRMESASPFEMALQSDNYSLGRILEVAQFDPSQDPSYDPALLHDLDPAIRYWAVLATQRMEHLDTTIIAELNDCLDDESGPVRLEAASALLNLGAHEAAIDVIRNDLNSPDLNVALYASRIAQYQPKHAEAIETLIVGRLEQAKALSDDEPLEFYIQFALEALIYDLQHPLDE